MSGPQDAAHWPLVWVVRGERQEMKALLWHLSWLLCLLCGQLVHAQTTLTFCYQDQPLEPYYRTAGSQVPTENPGATIEHLQWLATQVPELTLKYVRYPWKRCLLELQRGRVDAVVANYYPEREILGKFPITAQGIDQSRAFTEQDVCLLSKSAVALRWNGQSFADGPPIVFGYMPRVDLRQHPIAAQVNHVPIDNQRQAIHLLQRNQIQLTTILCAIAGQPTPKLDYAELEVLTPSVAHLTGYLVFSHQFFEKNQQLANKLWDLNQYPLDIYFRYLQDDYQE